MAVGSDHGFPQPLNSLTFQLRRMTFVMLERRWLMFTRISWCVHFGFCGILGLFSFLSVSAATYVQSSDPSGLAVIEAEHFAKNVSSATHSWDLFQDQNAAGGVALRALPDDGTNNNTGYLTLSPHLDYEVRFSEIGTYYVWARCLATTGTDDSLHVALDGQEVTTADSMSFTSGYGLWTWSNDTIDEVPATIDVPTAGVHTIQVFMREDGVRFDKILLTKDATYVPSGLGPAESTVDNSGGNTPSGTQRFLSATEIATASPFIKEGDLPVDTFTPPINAVFVAAAGGNDAGLGTSDQPFATLDKAIAFVNARPDIPYTINLLAGVHYFKRVDPEVIIRRSNLYIRNYNSVPVAIRPYYWPNNPTTYSNLRCFRVEGPYSNITFDGFTLEGWERCFSVTSGDLNGPALKQVVIKNMLGQNYTARPGESREFFEAASFASIRTYPGIMPDPEAAHFPIEDVIISNVETHDSELGIDVGDEYNPTIKGFRISHFRFLNPPPPPINYDRSDRDAIALVNCYKVVVDSAEIRNTIDDGVDCKSYDVMVVNSFLQGVSKNAVKFWRNGELVNTYIYDCGPFYDDAALVVKFGPCWIINSAIVKKQIGYTETLGIDETGPSLARSLQIANSIFCDLYGSLFILTNSLTSLNSVYWNMRRDLFTGGVGNISDVSALNQRSGSSGNIAVDPMLSDPANGDFHPKPGSPLIDRGTSEGMPIPSFDFYGNARVAGKNVDIGPIEVSLQVPFSIQAFIDSKRNYTIQWVSANGAIYALETASNVEGPWADLAGYSNIQGTGGLLSISVTGTSDSMRYYRAKQL
jgi:hypothetical protein